MCEVKVRGEVSVCDDDECCVPSTTLAAPAVPRLGKDGRTRTKETGREVSLFALCPSA